MSTLATLAISLTGDIGGFLSQMGVAEKAADSAGSSIASKLGQGLATVGKLAAGIAAAGIVAAGTAILGSMNVTMDWASKLDDLGDVLGTTANEGAAVLVALKPFGSAGEEITGQMAKLAAGLEDGKGGLGESGKLMKKLGIEFKDAHGKMLPATKLMENIGNKVSAMPDGLEKTALMMDLFGKSGKGMSDAMSALSTGGMEEARKKAEAFGLTIGEDGLANTLDMQKGLADLELAGQGLAVTFGGPLLKAILPIVEGMAKWAVQVMPGVRDGLSQITAPLGAFITLIGNFAGGLAAGADPFGLITNAIFQFLQMLGMGRDEAGNFAVTAGASIQAFVGQATALFQQVVGWVQTNFPIIRDTIVGIFNQAVAVATPIINSIVSVIQTVFGAISGFLAENGTEIQGFFSGVWTRIQGIISGVIGIINLTIVPVFQAIAQFISDNQETIKAVIEVVWNGIKMAISNALTIIEGVIKVFTKILQGDWAGAWQSVKETVEQVWKNIMDFLGGFPAKLVQIGTDIINGIIKGIKDAADQVTKALLEMLKGAVDAVKAFFGIKSPSKLMAGIGFNVSAGMAAGIMKGSGLVTDAMGALGMGTSAPSAVSVGSGGAGVMGSVGAGGNGTPVIQVFIGEEQLEPILAKMIYRSQRRAYA